MISTSINTTCLLLAFFVYATPALADLFLYDDIVQCEKTCSPHCSLLISNLEFRLNRMKAHCNENVPHPPKPHDPPSSESKIEIYHSDYCSDYLIATIGPNTDCTSLANAGTDAWGVKVNGVCQNISDTSIQNACMQFQGAVSSSTVTFHNNDSCESTPLMAVDSQTKCNELNKKGNNVWAVKVGRNCYNIPDTSEQTACHAFNSAALQNTVRLYHSDRCDQNSMLGAISANTQCSEFSKSGSDVWGIEIFGQCINIDDMSQASACNLYSKGQDPQAITLYHSDSCKDSSLIGVIASQTRCEDLPSSGSDVWAVKMNGKCQDINDTSYQQACYNLHP